MSEDVIKVPVVNWEIPKPKKWDFVSLIVVAVSVAAIGANLNAPGIGEAGGAISTTMSLGFFLVQLGICIGSVMLLGKTAKEGTIHGNLGSIGGMSLGILGMMLAAALWAAA